MTYQKVPKIVIDTVRTLSMDAVQKANSGHPGTPMGAAEMTLVLWSQFLRFHPEKPDWQDRDRFILSVGHASMLQYSLMHLFGYDLKLDEIKKFRQLGSRTAGHPEYWEIPGIETTTGPLGQGVANSVGMALGQALLAGKYNQGKQQVVNGHVWCLAGDGCMMEGISSEAGSLAGHLGLGNLTVIYDKNDVTIDGSTELTFSEDVAQRFEAFGWEIIKVSAYDQAALADAFARSKKNDRQPTLIVAQSVIGRGSATLEGSEATHGAALGEDEVAKTKKKMGWPDKQFLVPEEALEWCRGEIEKKIVDYDAWSKDFKVWRKDNLELAEAWDAQWAQAMPADLWKRVAESVGRDKAATRKQSGKAINRLAKEIPWFIGGSADLTGSNNSEIKDATAVTRTTTGGFGGRNIYFGVREHAMAAATNGLNLHGAWRSYCATFLQFSDYMRPAIRLASMMKAKSVFVFTHDSFYLGEDGPTHQPVEHIPSLRMIPQLQLWRPADGLETAMAWTYAVEKAPGATVLCLTRQNVPGLDYAKDFDEQSIWRGGYIIKEAEKEAQAVIIATGSEVATACEAQFRLAEKGVHVRVVSMPCQSIFDQQDEAYRKSVLGEGLPLASVEASSTVGWRGVVGPAGLCIGLDQFGQSAPGEVLAEHFGFTGEKVAAKIEAWVAGGQKVKA